MKIAYLYLLNMIIKQFPMNKRFGAHVTLEPMKATVVEFIYDLMIDN